MTDYAAFLASKRMIDKPSGLNRHGSLNPMLFDFQSDIVRWALRRGRAAIFADCGMGKTAMQLEWAKQIREETGGDVLIVAPLAVSAQTVSEGHKFGVQVMRAQTDKDQIRCGITITNYERLHHFNPINYVGIVLDESSILKSYTGKYKQDLVANWGALPYRLACTATPAPNDYMELGNHAEFLGALSRTEMLSTFFVHDGGETQKWRLKGHAERSFWEWMCSWAVMIRKPSDLGYDDDGFTLPHCHIIDVVLDANEPAEGMLFALDAHTMQERRAARKASISRRVDVAAAMVNGSGESWLVWCDLNAESSALASAIHGAVEVKGSDNAEHKERSLMGFAAGDIRVLVSKPSIAGWGMNFQVCHNMIFTGLSDSYEQFYQAMRRCWRYGQQNEVKCYIVTDRTEGAVVANIRRKESDAERMAQNMVQHMAYISSGEIRGDRAFSQRYNANKAMEVPEWLTA